MAIFTCYVPTNNFGKGSPPPFDFSGGSFYFELDSPKYYELFGGSFTYSADQTPRGYVYTYGVYDYDDSLTRFWDANGGLYDATAIFNLKDTGNWREYFEYMFYLDDQIYGSAGLDKLNGFNGDDYIVGNAGNDKLKGGPGLDGFYFEAFDGRDTIKDFNWRYDTIWLDSSLATTIQEVYDAAFKFKKGVVLDFGDTVIKIPRLKPGDFDDADFGFL